MRFGCPTIVTLVLRILISDCSTDSENAECGRRFGCAQACIPVEDPKAERGNTELLLEVCILKIIRLPIEV